jgi:hypothetical protein
MKRNFKVAMKGYDGKELKNEKGEPQMMSDTIGLYLYAAGSKKPLEPADKMRAYKICVQLQEHPEEVELEAEDMALIKETINDALVAGAYGQIVQVLEKEV